MSTGLVEVQPPHPAWNAGNGLAIAKSQDLATIVMGGAGLCVLAIGAWCIAPGSVPRDAAAPGPWTAPERDGLHPVGLTHFR